MSSFFCEHCAAPITDSPRGYVTGCEHYPVERDLFGQAPNQPIGSRAGEPRGYAAMPGTGPQGETCKTCRHYAIRQRASAYRKCLLMRAVWTGGPGTDIKAGSPACSKWEPVVSGAAELACRA